MSLTGFIPGRLGSVVGRKEGLPSFMTVRLFLCFRSGRITHTPALCYVVSGPITEFLRFNFICMYCEDLLEYLYFNFAADQFFLVAATFHSVVNL